MVYATFFQLGVYIVNSIMYFEVDNDDMESSKRRSALLFDFYS